MKMTVQYTAYATKGKQNKELTLKSTSGWYGWCSRFSVSCCLNRKISRVFAQSHSFLIECIYSFFSLWLFDHRHFNFIHSGMIFTLLFSSWWEWSGIRLTYKQHCIYVFHGVPCHVINSYQSKLLANKFNENKNCPVILAFVCNKIVFCRTFSSFCTASWILIERWEWIKICFVRVCIRQLI